MTPIMRNSIEQAAYEAGRAAAKYEMLVAGVTTAAMAGNFIAESILHTSYPSSAEGTADGSIARDRTDRLVKAAKTPKSPKAPVIARGVKRVSGPREKGVKKAIVELITSEGGDGGISTSDIISKLGFKASSVNATLMGLKKTGIAMQDGKLWLPAPHSDTGNSEAAAQY